MAEECERCKEFLASLHRGISHDGFAVVSEGPSMRRRGWAYTVGLLDLADHPELVVAGWPLGGAVRVLEDMGHAVVDSGKRYDLGGPDFRVGMTTLGVFRVHETHLERGLMHGWHHYYDDIGRFDLELRAMQAVLPDREHCFEHQTLQPRLDDPRHVRFDGMGPTERRGHRGGSRQLVRHPGTPRAGCE